MIPGVTITLSNGNIGGAANTSDGVVGQVLTGAGTGTIGLLQPCKFVSLADAEAQGLTAAAEPEAHAFVTDFYNDAPIGSPLYLMLAANTATIQSLCDKTNANGAVKLLNFALNNAGGQIRVLGVSRSPVTGYVPATDQFIDSDAILAGANAQALAAQYFSLYNPAAIVIGARVADAASNIVFTPNTAGLNRVAYAIGGSNSGLFAATGSVVADYTTGTFNNVPAVALTGTGSGALFKVVVTAGAIAITPQLPGTGYKNGDTFTFAKGFDGGVAVDFVGTVTQVGSSLGSAGMGTVLAKVADTQPQVNIGRVKDGPLSVKAWYIGVLPTVAPANGTGTWYQQLNTLINAGYVTATTYPNGTAGYFLSDDPMATATTDDYQSLANRRVIDKASIIAYQAFIQYVNDNVELVSGGTMDPADIVDIKSQIENAMATGLAGNISGKPVCIIDPTQVFTIGTPFNAQVRVTPFGYLKQINVNLGFSL